jgi:PII-like signaling protein
VAVNDDALKLTVYFGESDRYEGHLLSDVLIDRYQRHGLQAAILLRAIEGFGIKHQLHTQRLLTLSEDLPLVSVALDTRAKIEALLPEVTEVVSGGLITLERARLLTGDIRAVPFPEGMHEATKLTLYVGRAERASGRPTYLQLVELLRQHGLDGATVLLGVDGIAHAERRRGRFFSRNADVPLMIVSVGPVEAISSALSRLGDLLAKPAITLERVLVCKQDGQRLAEPRRLPADDGSGLAIWQKLMIHTPEHARHDGHPLYVQIIRRLREAGASGATSLRGIWGFSGRQEPHGDRFLSLQRRVPVLTTVVDTPERILDWFEVIDELTDEAGLVTSEVVPAFQAIAPQRTTGGLRLARLHRDPG